MPPLHCRRVNSSVLERESVDASLGLNRCGSTRFADASNETSDPPTLLYCPERVDGTGVRLVQVRSEPFGGESVEATLRVSYARISRFSEIPVPVA